MTRGTAENIRKAALELLSEHSFADITTRELAKRAGVAEGTLFRHISTKADLFLTVYGDLMDEHADEYEAADRERAATDSAFAGDCVSRVMGIYEMRVAFYQRNFVNAVQYLLAAFDPKSPRRPRTVAQGERAIVYIEGVLSEAAEHGQLFHFASPRTIAENIHAVELHEIVRTPLRGYSSEELWTRLQTRLESILMPVVADP